MSIIYYHAIPAFEHYFQPKTVKEAVSLLANYGEEGRVLAGGTDLLVLMRSRALTAKNIIDITKIRRLDYIRYDGDTLSIGALATIRAVELSPIVNKKYPILYEAAHQMGTTQVKNMGTVVGNLCRASPSADTAPPLLVLEARMQIVGPTETRIVPLNEFFTGPSKTVLKPYEIVTEIQIPKLVPGSGTAFLRITRVAADLAKVNVASVVTIENGNCYDARIALGGVAPTPIRTKKAEAILKGSRLEEAVIENASTTAADETKPITDVRSTQEYRRQLSKVLVRRAIKISLERAEKGLKG